MVTQPKYSERVTIRIVRADPDGTWIIETRWQDNTSQPRSVFRQIDGSAAFSLDQADAWWLAGVIEEAVLGRLF